MSKLVVFDFDGTLTKTDSMLELTRYFFGPIRFVIGMAFLSPVLVLYKLKLLPNWRTKQYYLTHFFGGMPLNEFQTVCDRFASEKIPNLLRPGVVETINTYKSKGHQLVIVSASAENWLTRWGDENHLTVIGTNLEVVDGRITGKLNGRNCYGPEKVIRLKEEFDLDDFSEIIVYGDSRGDRELMELATQSFYKPFRGSS
ncbi:MAG: HAD-IB family hydrolase [Bacteroidetes bacterium]|nr:MAG: HAD-IB family hydrolase [Bacteroidota bacterium]